MGLGRLRNRAVPVFAIVGCRADHGEREAHAAFVIEDRCRKCVKARQQPLGGTALARFADGGRIQPAGDPCQPMLPRFGEEGASSCLVCGASFQSGTM